MISLNKARRENRSVALVERRKQNSVYLPTVALRVYIKMVFVNVTILVFTMSVFFFFFCYQYI